MPKNLEIEDINAGSDYLTAYNSHTLVPYESSPHPELRQTGPKNPESTDGEVNLAELANNQ